mmetsp:Transcript_2018/g.3973  ORF Transcript_2018/g.3973 Transcript_2018/m.3973 type:complete len:93 (-) Transcript_2018:44-322(-)
MLIAVVDPGIRPFANAMSMVAYNIMGYSLGSILPGAIMTWLSEGPMKDQHYSVLIWGMRTILLWSVIGFAGMALALRSAARDPNTPRHFDVE